MLYNKKNVVYTVENWKLINYCNKTNNVFNDDKNNLYQFVVSKNNTINMTIMQKYGILSHTVPTIGDDQISSTDLAEPPISNTTESLASFIPNWNIT
jgi:hypothetical protein